MLHQAPVFFGDTQKMLARAMLDAGHTETEIGLAIGVSVNNIIHWRREEGLAFPKPIEVASPTPLKSEASSRARSVADHVDAPPAADPRLITPAAAKAAYVAAVQPEGDAALELGVSSGAKVFVDLEELLTTRLLVQGNSGSGKSHLLRKVLEESTGIVQQIVIDPEGDFVSLGETFGHTVVDATKFSAARLRSIALKTREHRGSVVLSLDGLEIEQQMDLVAAFLGGLFDAPPEHWFPALVVIDEAHLFAPAGDNGEDKEIRKASQQAVANLMCRGRKRGLAGVIATQRLSKMHKNVAAEASNFLLGRTYLDIDIARAADLLGMSKADSEQVRNLERGEFLGLGPAIARRPLKVKVGSVLTAGKSTGTHGLVPLPTARPEALADLLLAEEEDLLSTHTALRVVK